VNGEEERERARRLLLPQAGWQLAGLAIWLVFELLRRHPDPGHAALAGQVSWLLLLVPLATILSTWRGLALTPWPTRLSFAIAGGLLSAALLLLLILIVGTPIHLALGGLL
jgi:hypothetical protein